MLLLSSIATGKCFAAAAFHTYQLLGVLCHDGDVNTWAEIKREATSNYEVINPFYQLLSTHLGCCMAGCTLFLHSTTYHVILLLPPQSIHKHISFRCFFSTNPIPSCLLLHCITVSASDTHHKCMTAIHPM
jgi:hypothetical protein